MTAASVTARVRKVMPLVIWTAVLAAVITTFTVLGEVLPTPPLTEPGQWGAWLTGGDPLESVFGVGRLGVLGVAWYLLGTTVIGAAARLARRARLVRLADLLTVPAVRRLLQTALGVGFATAALTTVGAPDGAPHGPVSVAQVVDAEHADGVRMAYVGEVGGPNAVMRTVEDQQAAVSWQVRGGEHFWSIAETRLAESLGRAPSDQEIVPYWQRLIEHNRDALADPSNPDLLFPGQVLTVPAPDTLEGAAGAESV